MVVLDTVVSFMCRATALVTVGAAETVIPHVAAHPLSELELEAPFAQRMFQAHDAAHDGLPTRSESGVAADNTASSKPILALSAY